MGRAMGNVNVITRVVQKKCRKCKLRFGQNLINRHESQCDADKIQQTARG